MTEQEKVTLLVENYKLIADESKGYLAEILRCFIYFAVVLAYRFGYDRENTYNGFSDYMSWAFLCILAYLFVIGFMYINANRYKAQVEYKINKIANDDLFEFELIYKPNLLKNGFLAYDGRESLRFLPLPNILICVLIIVICVIIFWNKCGKNNEVLILITSFIALFFIYVFLFIPRQIEKFQRKNGWIK